MSAGRFLTSYKRIRRLRSQRRDIISDQVKKVLTDVDQKLILMVRS